MDIHWSRSTVIGAAAAVVAVLVIGVTLVAVGTGTSNDGANELINVAGPQLGGLSSTSELLDTPSADGQAQVAPDDEVTSSSSTVADDATTSTASAAAPPTPAPTTAPSESAGTSSTAADSTAAPTTAAPTTAAPTTAAPTTAAPSTAAPTTTAASLPGNVHPDIVSVVSVAGRNPRGTSWMDSYSVGDKCYCATTFDHNIGGILVDTPDGKKTVREVCDKVGAGPGFEGRPIYNDVQCGNGPANNAGDEDDCPGRVDIGREGCGHIGPRWDLSVYQ